MDYVKFKVSTDPRQSEALLAFFSEMPFDTFEENETGFDAYIPAGAVTEEVESYLGGLGGQFKFNFTKEFLPSQNWNEIWESNFHPVIVDGFCGIRADFHPPLQQVGHELVINPKMAFGTGHHETTFMAIQLMRHLPFPGSKVLDYGCGTGILAILASKLGAASVDAVDIEEESFKNTVENSQVNHAGNVNAVCGRLENVPGRAYDIVLANINRNVILASLPTLSQMTKPGGWLVVSGFILDDGPGMLDALAANGFPAVETNRRNNWLAIKARKEG